MPQTKCAIQRGFPEQAWGWRSDCLPDWLRSGRRTSIFVSVPPRWAAAAPFLPFRHPRPPNEYVAFSRMQRKACWSLLIYLHGFCFISQNPLPWKITEKPKKRERERPLACECECPQKQTAGSHGCSSSRSDNHIGSGCYCVCVCVWLIQCDQPDLKRSPHCRPDLTQQPQLGLCTELGSELQQILPKIGCWVIREENSGPIIG